MSISLYQVNFYLSEINNQNTFFYITKKYNKNKKHLQKFRFLSKLWGAHHKLINILFILQ